MIVQPVKGLLGKDLMIAEKDKEEEAYRKMFANCVLPESPNMQYIAAMLKAEHDIDLTFTFAHAFQNTCSIRCLSEFGVKSVDELTDEFGWLSRR
jgi:hypothetical protein